MMNNYEFGWFSPDGKGPYEDPELHRMGLSNNIRTVHWSGGSHIWNATLMRDPWMYNLKNGWVLHWRIVHE